ncbi:MAG: DNA polymerase II [Thermoplasmata archaeon HGW-Thermoplasmata-1]|nr:MAG: DNA polymerase II [Thermoplasmata archaeon HGW-Thermoplasmata-1]
MRKIVEFFSERGTLVQPEAAEYLSRIEDPLAFAVRLAEKLKEAPLMLTLDMVKEFEESSAEEESDAAAVAPSAESAGQKRAVSRILDLLERGGRRTGGDEEGEEPGDEAGADGDDGGGGEDQDGGPTKGGRLFDYHISKAPGWRPLAAEYDAALEIKSDVTGNSTCEGTLKDFSLLFSDRYDSLSKLLRRQRREVMNALPLGRIKNAPSNELQLIGMVSDVRTTVNGHRLIELEDDTGTATTIALKSNPDAISLAETVIMDEVVGITGRLSKNGELVIIENLVRPDVSMHRTPNRAELPLYAAFASDVHIGSNTFLEKEWEGMLRWLNGNVGNGRQRDVVGKIKYLILPGDVVDGIGIYPNQDKELLIPDIYGQYDALAKQLEMVPDHIRIIVQPGNHDAVRPAEPQPAFSRGILELFPSGNISFVGNPCKFSLHGVNVLSYHGQSLIDFATKIQSLTYDKPMPIMKTMLRMRHLAPFYGGRTPLAPEHRDYMVIDEVPDIFVTGHVHLTGVDTYRGVTMINASAWQSQTDYQKMMNFIPDPAKLPVVDLKSGSTTVVDFSRPL